MGVLPQVIPEGTGLVKGYGLAFFPFSVGAGGGGTPTPFGAAWGNGEGGCGASVRVEGCVGGVALINAGVPGRSQPSNGLLVIPSPRRSAA